MGNNNNKVNFITQKQREVLDFIVSCVQIKNRLPTLREICSEKKYSSTNSATAHIVALCKKGYLDYSDAGSCKNKMSLTEKTRIEYGFYDSGKYVRVLKNIELFCDHYIEDEEYSSLTNSKRAVHWAMMKIKEMLRT